jgi:hypothetical protein
MKTKEEVIAKIQEIQKLKLEAMAANDSRILARCNTQEMMLSWVLQDSVKAPLEQTLGDLLPKETKSKKSN